MFNLKRGNTSLFGLLIDPEKQPPSELTKRCQIFKKIDSIDFYLLGGTYIKKNNLLNSLDILKRNILKPIFLFPGLDPPSVSIVPGASGVICPIIIGSNDPYYLTGWHKMASQYLKKYSMASFPFGYILVRSKNEPIMHNGEKIYSIEHTDVLEAEKLVYTGTKSNIKHFYLEAGSGALKPVTEEMISYIKKTPQHNFNCGGGISKPTQIKKNLEMGADIIIVGNAVENKCDFDFVESLSLATKK